VKRTNVFDPEWNWLKILGDERVWGAIGHTSLYTGVAIGIELVLGLAIALLLDSDRKGYGVLRALMTLPLVVPPAVTGMMFLLMLDGSFGVLSRTLYALGLLSPAYPILATSSSAMMGILIADVWQWTPFMVLIMMAGLRALPKEPFEAAAIDGASAVQAFFKLTLPMLSRIIALAVLIRGVDLFRTYDYIKVMTEGGPGRATENLTAYAGTIYFKNADFPYASTIALLTLILLMVTSTIFIKIFKVRF
jgi:multiple sugar transport system permease protein